MVGGGLGFRVCTVVQPSLSLTNCSAAVSAAASCDGGRQLALLVAPAPGFRTTAPRAPVQRWVPPDTGTPEELGGEDLADVDLFASGCLYTALYTVCTMHI